MTIIKLPRGAEFKRGPNLSPACTRMLICRSSEASNLQKNRASAVWWRARPAEAPVHECLLMMCQTTEAAGVIDTLSARTQSHNANSPGRRSAAEASRLLFRKGWNKRPRDACSNRKPQRKRSAHPRSVALDQEVVSASWSCIWHFQEILDFCIVLSTFNLCSIVNDISMRTMLMILAWLAS